MAQYWSPTYWINGGEQEANKASPDKVLSWCTGGCIYRLMLCGSLVVVSGTRGLHWKNLDDSGRLFHHALEPSQRCFNALCSDGSSTGVYVGAEDGSINHVDLSSGLVTDPFDLPAECQEAAILDISISANLLFAASASGYVWCIDVETRKLSWAIDLSDGSIKIIAEKQSYIWKSKSEYLCSSVRCQGAYLLVGSKFGISLWHIESRQCTSFLPTNGEARMGMILRDSIVCGGAENGLYRYNLRGQIQTSMILANVKQVWDLAEYHHSSDVLGGSIAVAVDAGQVLLLPAVGRTPTVLRTQ